MASICHSHSQVPKTGSAALCFWVLLSSFSVCPPVLFCLSTSLVQVKSMCGRGCSQRLTSQRPNWKVSLPAQHFSHGGRMGNLQGYGGPLPQGWIESQAGRIQGKA